MLVIGPAVIVPVGAHVKKPGRRGVPAFRCGEGQPAVGRFIWQVVGVLDTYGSICLTGTKV